MAKLGYYGGDPNNVLEAPVDMVVDIFHYESFLRDFEETYYMLNKAEVNK